jgi:hypothetical protein
MNAKVIQMNAGLDMNKLTCRTYGHAWTPSKVIRTLNSRGKVIEYTSLLVCARCETERRQKITPEGELVRNNYTYAPGYLRDKGDPAYAKQDYRIEYIRTVRGLIETERRDTA